MADLQPEVVVHTLAQRLRRQRHHLQIGALSGHADQLDPRLENLVVVPAQPVVQPKHILRVVQPQRQRRVLQPGGGQPRDRHGGIGTNHQQPPFVIGQLIYTFRRDRLVIARHHIVKFDAGGHDLRKAALYKQVGKPVLHLAARQTFLKQQVAGALRRNASVLSHGVLRCVRFSSLMCYYDIIQNDCCQLFYKKGYPEPTKAGSGSL